MPGPAFAVGKDPDALLMTGEGGTGFLLTESILGDFEGLKSRGEAETDGIFEAEGGLLWWVGRRWSMVL